MKTLFIAAAALAASIACPAFAGPMSSSSDASAPLSIASSSIKASSSETAVPLGSELLAIGRGTIKGLGPLAPTAIVRGVPEPATWSLFGLAVAALLVKRRRRN